MPIFIYVKLAVSLNIIRDNIAPSSLETICKLLAYPLPWFSLGTGYW